MNSFDKIIGYDSIKEELLQIVDIIHNKEVFEELGAKLPQGLLLAGDPGLGKTLMAKSFIEAAGIPSFTIRRDKGNDDFVGGITATFMKAKENAPSIVFLDDMDKFANEDDRHCDTEEYVAVQSGIDEVKGNDVFVIATVNDFGKLPRSLTRSGRFDRIIKVDSPTPEDSEKIIRYYLKDKKVGDINFEDLAKMISYSSCAELESVLNEAAVYAGAQRKEKISMEDLVKAVLRLQYHSPNNYTKTSIDELDRTAWHEAGHLVVSEVLVPGSVGLISLRSSGRDSTGGFVHRCKSLERRPHTVLVSLAGKVATEMHFGRCASGCYSDLSRAADVLREGICGNASMGLGLLDVSHGYNDPTEKYNEIMERLIPAELESMMFKAKEILFANYDFLQKVHDALLEKDTLLYSEIQDIKAGCTITSFAI